MADWGLLVENYYKNHRRWNSTRIDRLILEVLGEEDEPQGEPQEEPQEQASADPEQIAQHVRDVVASALADLYKKLPDEVLAKLGEAGKFDPNTVQAGANPKQKNKPSLLVKVNIPNVDIDSGSGDLINLRAAAWQAVEAALKSSKQLAPYLHWVVFPRLV